MRRSATPATAPDRTPANGVDDIESEFLGLWLDVARLREKVLALIRRTESRHSIRSIEPPARTAAATSTAAPYSP